MLFAKKRKGGVPYVLGLNVMQGCLFVLILNFLKNQLIDFMISSVPVHEIISMFWWEDQLHFANSIN